MQLGMVGLARMGGNMTLRCLASEHQMVVYDQHPGTVESYVAQGATGDLDRRFDPPTALAEDPDLPAYTGFVEDSGEGRWTIQTSIEEAVPADVLSAALYTRFRSRQEHTYAEKLLSAMRHKFGGHVEQPAEG